MSHLTATPVLDPGQDRTMILNMGPQHPSTHGVLRVLLEIDAETVVRIMPDIGFLHTGIEKTCEAKFYHQVVPLTDRIDYLCPLTNNLCYVLAVEKLLGLEIPPKAQWMRVLLNELDGRRKCHWLRAHGHGIRYVRDGCQRVRRLPAGGNGILHSLRLHGDGQQRQSDSQHKAASHPSRGSDVPTAGNYSWLQLNFHESCLYRSQRAQTCRRRQRGSAPRPPRFRQLAGGTEKYSVPSYHHYRLLGQNVWNCFGSPLIRLPDPRSGRCAIYARRGREPDPRPQAHMEYMATWVSE